MCFLTKIQSVIKQTDMFYSNQFLRYKSSNQYKTVTGGIATLVVLVAISVSFVTMIIETVSRVNISYDIVANKAFNPPQMTVNVGPGKNFMFGLRLMSQYQNLDTHNTVFNLSEPKRYFNINFRSTLLKGGNIVSSTSIPLQTCTKAHWTDFPKIVTQYQLLEMSKWLCPPINSSFDLQGQYSSGIAKMAMFEVSDCSNDSNFNKIDSVCATPEEITANLAQTTNFVFGYLFTNAVINPGQTKYIDYYLQFISQTIFSSNLGSYNLINYSDFQIDSDDSIWPFPSIETDSGIVLDGNMASRPLSKAITSSTYLRVMLFKSNTSLKIKRSVQKMTAIFSYIAGLFGAIATTLFLLRTYTDQAFEISLVKTLFSLKKKAQENKILSNFNIFKFLAMKAYSLIKLIKIPVKWQKGEYVDTFQQQIKKQLDVSFILHRLINLEKMMTVVLNENQIKELALSQRLTLEGVQFIQKQLGYVDDLNQQDEGQSQANESDVKIINKQGNNLFMESMSQGSSVSGSYKRSAGHQLQKKKKEHTFFMQSNNKKRNEIQIPVTFTKYNQQQPTDDRNFPKINQIGKKRLGVTTKDLNSGNRKEHIYQISRRNIGDQRLAVKANITKTGHKLYLN